MPQYPRNQAQVVSQIDNMIAGFREHPELFPGSDPDRLADLRENFLTAGAKLNDAEGLAKSAAKEKLACFELLRQAMKDQIKRSQADTSGHPVYLSYIGWGEKAKGEPITSPGSPTSLTVQPTEGDGLILNWDKPDRDSGGPVGCYLVQAREMSGNMNENHWQLVATTFETQFVFTSADAENLSGRCEFRIIAANKAGQSLPSNTVVMILPEMAAKSRV